MKTVQLAFGRNMYQSLPAGRKSAPALAASKKTKEPANIPILFGSYQSAQTTAKAVDEAISRSGLNHSMAATGLLVAGAAVGLGAIMGLLFLLPIGLMLAAAGGALFMSNKQTKQIPPTLTETGQQQKVFHAPTFEKAPFTGALTERTSQGTVVLLSSVEDEIAADEPTTRRSLSSMPLPKPNERAEQAKQPPLSASVSGGKERPIPGGLSPFEFPAQNSPQAIASSEKPASLPVIKESDTPQPSQVLFRSAGDWRQYPVKLNNNTVGYPKSRFIRSFSGIEELNEELKLAPNNNNFAGVTLYQVAFNNINFPPNTDFRQLKVEKAVSFENCKLPGASFEGIQGTGKITFINTDLADTIYDPADSHFMIRNSDTRPGVTVN